MSAALEMTLRSLEGEVKSFARDASEALREVAQVVSELRPPALDCPDDEVAFRTLLVWKTQLVGLTYDGEAFIYVSELSCWKRMSMKVLVQG